MTEHPIGVQDMDKEEEEQWAYPAAYSPIPKRVIKEEEISRENNVEQQMKYLVAYPPIPRGPVKEEVLFGDAQEKCNGQAQQLVASSRTSNGTINQELEQSIEEQNALNLDEGQQVSLEPLIAYPPNPRCAIKEEPFEEKEGDEQPQQVIIAYPPIARGRIKEELQFNVNQDEPNVDEHQLDLEPINAYPPIQRGVIKEEPFEGKGEEQAKQVIAYPPIPSGRIKEESVDNSDDFNLEEHQLVPQEGGNRNLLEESTPAPIISPTDDVSTTDRGNGTERRKSQRRKKIAVASTSAISPSRPTGSGDQSTRAMSTIGSRTRQLKRGSTSLTKDDDGEKDNHTTEDRGNGAQRPKSKKRKITSSTADTPSSTGTGDQSAKTSSTVSTETRSHHSKLSSASMARNINGETSKIRKVTKDDKRNERNEKSSLSIDGDSSSSFDETSEQPPDSHSRFQKKCSLRLHFLKTHTETGHATRPLHHFQCDQCLKTYKRKNSLVQHLMNDCRIDPAFPCPKCDYKATNKSNLRRHLISIHEVDTSKLDNVSAAAALCARPVFTYKCDTCESTFKSKDSLYSHKKYACGVAKYFSCLKCDYRTARRHDLRKHLMDVHDVEPSQLVNFGAGKVVRPQLPFKCDKCERSYKHKHHLKDHMDFECGKIPSFPCNQCGYRSSRNSNLKRHIDAVHGSSSLQA